MCNIQRYVRYNITKERIDSFILFEIDFLIFKLDEIEIYYSENQSL